MAYVLVFSRCLLAVVFLVSAASKLRNPRGFRASLAEMRVLPERAVAPVAVVVTVAEAAVVLLLLMPGPNPVVSVVGLGFAVLLLTGFAIAIVVVLRRGSSIPCRCFGASSAPLATHHVARNGLLALVAALGLVASLSEPTVDWPSVVLTGPLGIIVAALVVRLDDLVALFAPTTVRR